MATAGAEERRIAIERKSFQERMPAVSVICDDPKRSTNFYIMHMVE